MTNPAIVGSALGTDLQPPAPDVTGSGSEQVEVLMSPADLRASLELDARAGLLAKPKWLPPKYFYDERGSRLFEDITRLPEYYPTRCERSLLRDHARTIVAATGATALLELGSGSSEKTRPLLDALAAVERLRAYVPVDVSAVALTDAMRQLRREYPALDLHGVVADFDQHLAELPTPGRRLIALLGGTIGNYAPKQRQVFLAQLAAGMAPGESFLVGLDLVKSPLRLVSAYDDAAGVTAEFNRNVLHVLNGELGADFSPDAFDHVAQWDPEHEWIEMRLRANRHSSVHVAALGIDVVFDEGEQMRTEISAKFRRARFDAELRRAGLTVGGWWTDGDFALVLAHR